MMGPKIKQLYPPPPKPIIKQFVQCSEIVPPMTWNPAWRQERYANKNLKPECCVRQAQYRIDGKPYCSAHAGRIALHYWATGKIK